MSRRFRATGLAVAFLLLCPASQASDAIQVDAFVPEPIHVSVDTLPKPFATESAQKRPDVKPVPESPRLQAPAGFKVNEFTKLKDARWLALTPDGEVLCAASKSDKIVLLRDADSDGVAEEQITVIDKDHGARMPFGMAFADDALFVGNTDAVLRYEFNADSLPLSDPQKITDLPGRGYNEHWTRNVVVSPEGDRLFVSVGSRTNADVEEPPRASVLTMNLDGSDRSQYATGLRNPVGLGFHPQTGRLFSTINERDGLGDNLVPDYLTEVVEGEFYGWPYAYLKPENLDPRRVQDGKSERPELAAKTRTPDLLFESHSAALGLAFYDQQQFPEKYRNGAFVAHRGSWNRDTGVGYKIVFVPFDQNGSPKGYYEDFVRGFLTNPEGPVAWARPVGVVVTPDGGLLFTDDANGRVYRVTYEE